MRDACDDGIDFAIVPCPDCAGGRETGLGCCATLVGFCMYDPGRGVPIGAGALCGGGG